MTTNPPVKVLKTFGRKYTKKKDLNFPTKDEGFEFILRQINMVQLDKKYNMSWLTQLENCSQQKIIEDWKEDTMLEKINAQSHIINFTDEKVKCCLLKLRPFKTWPSSTDILCYYCKNQFDSIPLGLPVVINDELSSTRYSSQYTGYDFKLFEQNEKSLNSNKIYCQGVYCSFNCILNEINEHPFKYSKNSFILFNIMYETLLLLATKLKKQKIIQLPHWIQQTKFGGNINFTDYHSSSINLKIESFTSGKDFQTFTETMISIPTIYQVFY